MRNNRPGEFAIVSLYDPETEEFTQEFFRPDDGFFSRTLRLSELKSQGFKVAGILYVNKETYYNAKLANLCSDYIKQDNFKREAQRDFDNGRISADDLFLRVQCCEDTKWTTLKSITKMVRRMQRWQLDVESEIALQLYDQYMDATLKF